MSIQVSLVINCHREGILLHRTFKNIRLLVENARQSNIHTEVIVTADNPDMPTADCLAREKLRHKNYSFYEVHFSDLGKARNFSVQQARGKYVTFLDGDDLYTCNWITASYSLMEQLNTDCVLFPEWVITFQSQIFSDDSPFFVKENFIHHMADFLGERLSMASILDYHPYTSSIFSPRHLLEKYPYVSNAPEIKIAYEDWYQNCTFLYAEIPLLATMDTALFYRKAPEIKASLLMHSKKNKAVLDKHPLFDPSYFRRRYTGFSDWVTNHKAIEKIDTPPHYNKKYLLSTRMFQWISYWKSRLTLLCIFFYHKMEQRLPRKNGYIISPIVHRFLMATKERVKNKIKQSNVLNGALMNQLSPFIIQQWQMIARDIEPELILAPNFNRLLSYVIPKKSTLTNTYYQVCEAIGEAAPYDHIIIAPYLPVGGASKVIIQYMNALLTGNIDKKILLITTLPDPSTHLHLLHKNIQIIELGKHYLPQLLKEQHTLLLYRILIQFTNTKITLMNSNLGYQVFSLYGGIFKRHAIRCYAFIFSIERTQPDALPHGYAVAYYYALARWFDMIFTDNQNIIRNAYDLLGIPIEKCRCLYQPVERILSEKELHATPNEKPLRLIWVSRLSAEKQPELLIELIKALANEPITLDIYTEAKGTPYYSFFSSSLPKNVHYKGSYANWYDLHPEQYDALLYTGVYDGMPNVVLEALSSGLVVIAANQNQHYFGGLGEIITHNDNGFLVDDYKNAAAYIAFVRKLEKNRNLKGQFYAVTKDKLEKQHSHTAYLQKLKTLMHS